MTRAGTNEGGAARAAMRKSKAETVCAPLVSCVCEGSVIVVAGREVDGQCILFYFLLLYLDQLFTERACTGHSRELGGFA